MASSIDDVILTLKDALNTDLDLKIKEKSKKKKEKENSVCSEQSQHEEASPLIDLEKLSTEELLINCNSSKKLCMKFHHSLSFYKEHEVDLIVNKLDNYYGDMICHPFGSYVIQKLLTLNSSLVSTLDEFCSQQLKRYVLNEYSSRVLQTLLERNISFRDKLVALFKDDPKLSLSQISVIYLITACIKSAADTDEIRFLMVWLDEQPDMIKNTNFQRVLAIYVQYCSELDLHTIAESLMVNISISSILNTKILTYLAIKIIKRGYPPLVMLVCNSITTRIELLLEANFFNLLLTNTFEENIQPAGNKLTLALASLDETSIRSLEQHKTHFNYYIYLTLLGFKDCRDLPSDHLTKFFTRKPIARQICTLLKVTAVQT